jgi:hypothetical protein
MVAVPKNVGDQFIIPVAASITPAAAGETEKAMEELFAAVALYVSSESFWHMVAAPAVKIGVPVNGFTITIYVVIASVQGLFETVIVKVTVVPASLAAAV